MINHLAVVMDGNRRWAKNKNLKPWDGHQKGTESLKTLIEFCLEQNISMASVYAFSIENFARSSIEKDFIFDIMLQESENFLPNLIKNKIKIRFCGNKDLFPASIIPAIKKLENSTDKFNQLQLNIIFCYGGKQEILNAVKRIVEDTKKGLIGPENINEENFDNYLWTNKIPEPELIIRTGNISRLSNFLLYKSAYSELYFSKKLWPDLTKSELLKALNNFKLRKRNFGK